MKAIVILALASFITLVAGAVEHHKADFKALLAERKIDEQSIEAALNLLNRHADVPNNKARAFERLTLLKKSFESRGLDVGEAIKASAVQEMQTEEERRAELTSKVQAKMATLKGLKMPANFKLPEKLPTLNH